MKWIAYWMMAIAVLHCALALIMFGDRARMPHSAWGLKIGQGARQVFSGAPKIASDLEDNEPRLVCRPRKQ